MKDKNQPQSNASNPAGELHLGYRFGLVVALLIIVMFTGVGVAAQAPGTASVELVIALDVAERQPVGASHMFPADTSHVVAWTRVTGASGTTIEHVWRYEEYEFIVPLDIGGPSWRTWSRKTIPVGWTSEWTVEIRDAEGNVLATDAFRVGGSPLP